MIVSACNIKDIQIFSEGVEQWMASYTFPPHIKPTPNSLILKRFRNLQHSIPIFPSRLRIAGVSVGKGLRVIRFAGQITRVFY